MTKNKWFGSFLNFLVPGLGNFYARNIKKGILIYILFFIVVFSLRFIAFNFALFLVSITLIICYYLFMLISGYHDVKKNKVYEPAPYDKWYVYVLILIFHWVLGSTIKGKLLDNLTPINFASIPTPAMEPTLLVGDILAFKKTKAIERNDVTIFWFPDEVQTKYIKRCIGLPGDSLQIASSKVLINGTPVTSPSLKFKYLVTTDGTVISSRFIEKNRMSENDYAQITSGTYLFYLTNKQAKDIKGFSFIKKVELLKDTEGAADEMIFPKSENFKWNADFYGPIYIPRKGDKIQLTDKNIDFYFKSIAFENNSVERTNTGLKINGQLVTKYEFKDNYFFMMGDSRHNSLDSRYWGLLPEKLVIGKAIYLYWGSTNDRIGKKIM